MLLLSVRSFIAAQFIAAVCLYTDSAPQAGWGRFGSSRGCRWGQSRQGQLTLGCDDGGLPTVGAATEKTEPFVKLIKYRSMMKKMETY